MFPRPPRQAGPKPPKDELRLEPPLELTKQLPRGLGQVFMLVPMLAGMGAMALMMSSSGSASRMWMGGGLFAASILGMVFGFFAGGGAKRAELNSQRRDYLRHLGQARRRVRRSAEAQRVALLWRHPDPSSLWSMVEAGRIWERRPDDPDFTQIRLATGPQKAAVGLIVAEAKPVEDLEPLTAIALRRFLRAHSQVDELPIALAMKAFSRVLLRGDRARTLDLARAVLCQLATFHAPGELRIAAVVADDRRGEWEWLKWLPHTQHAGRSDAAGALRLVFESLMELEEVLRDELSSRVGAGGVVIPHIVVLCDGGDAPAAAALRRSAVPGVTLLDISGVLARGAGRAINLEVAVDGQLSRVEGEASSLLGRADALGPAAAEAVARQLSPWRLAVKAQANAVPVSTDFTSLMGLGDLETFDLRTFWKPREDKDRLKIPLGLSPDGAKVDIDFKESAHQGMGPHGILIGGTGSGKSELLRSIVAALAVTHSSEDLNFVLVDFKGGATFASLDVLPHTSAIITNLSDELPLVDRMEEALRGELVRRQELLRKEGNYVSRYDYAKDRAAGKPLGPMPSLLIICDEFSELLTAKPSFADLFLQIGRVGRSLGVHILLASQRLEEGKLRGLDSLLSYRIGLRTDAATDSRAVIGVADAAELPKGGGHGYLKPDPSTLLRFRGTYISGPYRRKIGGDSAGAVAEASRQVVPFTTSPVKEAQPAVQAPRPVAPVGVEPEEDDSRQAITTLDLIVERLKGQGTPAHKVWLDPLDLPPTLDQIFASPAEVTERPGRGLSVSDGPTLRTPIGVVDKPADQRRDPLDLDLDGAGGNILVIGGTRTGKSTLLRTFITSLALTHTPYEVQFFCLDFGGGSLRGLDELPHVCGVANRREIEAVRRTVSEVTAILDEREARFAELGTDIAEWRKKRASGAVTDDPFGDVFLVVDNWTTVREEFDSLEPVITGLATRGLNFGIHVVVTAPRYVDVRSNLRDALRTRLELRLGDPSDSELDRKAAVNVPAGRPGRGLASLGGRSYHYLIALPRADGVNDSESVSEGTAALVARSRAGWQGPPVRRVRLLPQLLSAAELNAQVPPEKAESVLIGLNESKLAPVRLDFARDPHLIMLGDTECGKTNLLRHIARQITAENEQNKDLSNVKSPRQSRIIIVDFKRSLLEIADGPMVFKYVTSATDLTDTIKELRGVLTQRLPGRDVTPAQLRERSWWKGKALYLMIDDYDLVGGGGSPLGPLSDLLSQGADIGFHVIIARRASGASRAMHESVITQMRNIETPILLMSGPADEGALVGKLRPGPLPPGRGHLVRRDGTQTIQTAWSAI